MLGQHNDIESARDWWTLETVYNQKYDSNTIDKKLHIIYGEESQKYTSFANVIIINLLKSSSTLFQIQI